MQFLRLKVFQSLQINKKQADHLYWAIFLEFFLKFDENKNTVDLEVSFDGCLG